MKEKELVGNAFETADDLFENVSKTYDVACDINPVLALLLTDVLKDVASIKDRLEEIHNVLF